MVKIEEGKYYRTRDGDKVGPMEWWGAPERAWHFRSDEKKCLWTGDGMILSGNRDGGGNIISEWTSFDFDPNWPHGHVTRDGRKARIVCTDAHGEFPTIALVPSNGEERPIRYGADGREASGCDGLDLINALVPKREFWVNVYANGDAFTWDTREIADNCASEGRIACVRVTEGDGL